MHRRTIPLLVAGLLAAATALAAPLTEAEALRLALARSELAELAEARRGEAEAELVAARLWANPSLELARERVGDSRETSWQLRQPLDLSGRRGLRQDAAERRLAATEADNRGHRVGRAGALRLAFHQLLLQQGLLRAGSDWAARFERVAEVVGKLARAGEASGYDRRRLEREQRSALARVAENRADVERARARLAALLGRDASEGVTGDLLPAPPPGLPALQAKLAERSDLAALAARADAADAEKRAAASHFPELTLGIGGKRVDDGIVRDSGTIVSLSLPLPLFDHHQAEHRRSAAQAQAARAELALARRQADGELLGLHRQTTLLIDAAQRHRREAVAGSVELLRIAEAAYRGGESTVLELLDAYRGALEAETTALDLEWKARQASLELDQLTGSIPE